MGTQNWMSALPNNIKLSRLTIPGTHESCSRNLNLFANCQDMDLASQLNAGIRYLDIRCRQIQDIFAIHHGPDYVGFNFGDVCNTCNVWLQANPNECILMQIKRECVELPPTCASDPGNTLTFEGVFDKYMQQFGSFFYLMDSIPTLGDVRSKIVLVRRFDTTNQSNHGLSPNPWKDNATFSVSYTAGNGDQVTFQVQDEYQYADDRTKLRAINALLAQASADSNDTFYINFTSAATTPPFGDPAGIAEGIQLELYPDLAKIFANRLGVLMLDFPDRFIPNNGLVERIIGLNDGLKTHSQATDRNSALTAAAG